VGVHSKLAAATAIVLTAACATPSRRLSTRQVEDPITLPRRLASVSDGIAGTLGNEHGSREGRLLKLGYLEYGLTDRITLENFTAMRIAIMDDVPEGQPATGIASPGSPFGLAVNGGLQGAGYGDAAGFIAVVYAGVVLAKHVGRSVLIDGSARWTGLHRSRAIDEEWTEANLGVMAQLIDHVAVGLGAYDRLYSLGFAPSWDWTSQTIGAGPDLRYRPFHWLSLGASVDLERIVHHDPLLAVPPFEAIPPAPKTGPWASVWGSLWAYFYW
jgi:hypothetical protein